MTTAPYVVNVYGASGELLAFREMDTIHEATVFAKAHVRSLHEGCYCEVRGASLVGGKGPLILDTRDAEATR